MTDDEWELMDACASRDMWRVIAGIGWVLFFAALLVIYRGGAA